MNAGLIIREAGIPDAEDIATLFSEFSRLLGVDGLPDEIAFLEENVVVSRETMARRLQRMAGIEHVLLAELHGRPAGLCCLRLVPYIGQDAPYAEVTQLYVRAEAQRRGVGAALLDAAEQRARAAGATAVQIVTGADNTGAKAFYAAQGYAMPGVVFWKYLEAVKV